MSVLAISATITFSDCTVAASPHTNPPLANCSEVCVADMVIIVHIQCKQVSYQRRRAILAARMESKYFIISVLEWHSGAKPLSFEQARSPDLLPPSGNSLPQVNRSPVHTLAIRGPINTSHLGLAARWHESPVASSG